MKITAAIQSIKQSGFVLNVENGQLLVEPFSKLSDTQLKFLRQHKAEIIAELQMATVHDLDRHAAEKEAAIRYWRFRHNGVEADIASGATVAEAAELLRVGPDDLLEPIIEHDGDAVPHESNDPMPGWQETTIRMWLHHIGETDPEIIAETINKCHADVDAREFFLDRARKVLGDGEPVICGDCLEAVPGTMPLSER